MTVQVSGGDDVEAQPPASTRSLARLDDPLSRFYRAPLARLVVRGLVHTPVTANHLSLLQPLLAGAAGYLVTFPDRRLVFGAMLFEARALLACSSVALARARGESSGARAAADIVADGLAGAFLYAGIFWHFRLQPPPAGVWSHYVSLGGVLLLALALGWLRSLAVGHYQRKYSAAFEAAGSPFARFVALVSSLSNGDAFMSLVTLAMLTGHLWQSQLFFAVAGLPWLLLVVALNTRFASEGAWSERTARGSAPP